jgi:hypothetical protein
MNIISKIGLILGQHMAAEVQFIMKEVERQGHIAIVIDTRNISQSIHIEYHTAKDTLGLIIYGQKVAISKIAGVYWASVNTPSSELAMHPKNTNKPLVGQSIEPTPNPTIVCTNTNKLG